MSPTSRKLANPAQNSFTDLFRREGGSQPVVRVSLKGVRDTFQGVRGRPPLHPIYMLIYQKMGSMGYNNFFIRGTVFKKC